MENIEVNEKGYRKYVESKLGDAKPDILPQGGRDKLVGVKKAASILAPRYDLGIELANDGLWLGYVFSQYGLPSKTVKLYRKGRGASWNPLEKLSEENIGDKRILIFDIDIVTGRTLIRSVNELLKNSPMYLDLLLVRENSILTIGNYKKWRSNLPPLQELIEHSYPYLNDVSALEIDEGFYVSYLEEGLHRSFTKSNGDFISFKSKEIIPNGVRKFYTIEGDFSK